MSNHATISSIDALYEHTHLHAFGGARHACIDRIGLEVEVFAFMRRRILDDRSGCLRKCMATRDELIAWLVSIAEREGWDACRARLATPSIAIPGRGMISLEPGGQIEYSARPFADVVDALDDVDDVMRILHANAGVADIELRSTGYNTECDVDDIGLQLDAARYRVMDAYFASIGPFGQQMMRSTAALQISLDFGVADVAAERWRLANMIAPSMNALFANSRHLFEGRVYRSYRSEVWRRTDPTRTGRLFDKPDLDPVADYLRFALDAFVMLVEGDDGQCAAPPIRMTFREWITRTRATPPLRSPTIADWELHLTTLFPDVRARGSMELRSIDALGPSEQRVAVGLVAALMYVDDARREALHRLETRTRERSAFDHEHDGFWRADLSTGLELLALALPFIDPRLREACERFHTDRRCA